MFVPGKPFFNVMKEYFSHDYNARSDRKMVNLQMKHGMTGIGIYWCLVEIAYENNGNIPFNDCERIAFELRTEYERIISVLQDFELFILFDGNYRSESIDRRLQERKDKSIMAKKSIDARWNRVRNQELNTNVLQTNEERNTIKVNKSKVNKSKEDSKTWRNDYETYLNECKSAFNTLYTDKDFIAQQTELNPGVDVLLSIKKGFVNFWGTEAGWKHKKKSKGDINWKLTVVNAIGQNKVYLPRDFTPKTDKNTEQEYIERITAK